MKFSPEQNDVINLNSGWHACLAPAGSGKTEILTERVSRAIEGGVDPSRMLCLTFTNRAARSMVERVEARLGTRSEKVFIGNTHAYALKMLSRNNLLSQTDALADEATVNRLWQRSINLAVLNVLTGAPETAKEIVTHELLKVAPLELEVTTLNRQQLDDAYIRITAKQPYDRWNLKAISSLLQPLFEADEAINDKFLAHIKERLLVLDSNITDVELPLAVGLALVAFGHYCADKESLCLYDFDDLLIRAWKALNAGSAKKMCGYTWCQIDEVQDLSPLQWQIIQTLLSDSPHVLLLGDIRQSIYRFLGASVEVTQHQLGDSHFQLTKNFRSPANLNEMADAYCRAHFKETQSTKNEKPEREAALVHVNRNTLKEHDQVLLRHANKLINHDEKPSVAFLCPTNKQVEIYSEKLTGMGLEHFTINKKDLFSSELGLDFMAFINVLYEPKNRLAWSRLLWRFGDLSRMSSDDRQGDEPQVAAMRLLAKLGRLGCELHDFLGGESSLDYRLRRFHQDANTEITYFDTETTGLNPDVDAVIQIAGVRIKQGVASEEVNLYCHTEVPLGESVDVHHISEEILTLRGRPVQEQLQQFMQFSSGSVLIAHNLPFDDAMLRSHLERWVPSLLGQYTQRKAYCTLDLARRLYPDLPKHKLGFLLDHFKLEGVNSHNALDDVRAGVSLLKLLIEEVGDRLEEIDRTIDPFAEAIERFNARFFHLWKQVQTLREKGESVSLSTLLELYFGYVANLKGYKVDQQMASELRRKLNNHAQIHFPPAPLHRFLSRCVPFYQTAKESDLITDHDRLVVSTIHRAKGLEFDRVILPQMINGVMPSFWVTKQLDDKSPRIREEGERLLEEQKRLLYVALTRAKEQLVIGTYNLEGRYQKTVCNFLEPILGRFMNR